MSILQGRGPRLDFAPRICRVLHEDVGLAEAIPEVSRPRAVEECTASVAEIPRGTWNGYRSETPGGIGLLVLEGLLIRQVGIGLGYGAELLGEGDLLRPWQEQDAQPLAHTTGWRVLEPTRLAVLDRPAAHRFAHYPELTGQLVGRALERSRNLAVNMAIVQQSRVQTRLHMLMWHLANRWGYVRPDGVILPLRLTHSVLSDLVAARRPSVSVALSEMARAKLVRRVPEGWLLSGAPRANCSQSNRPTPDQQPRSQPGEPGALLPAHLPAARRTRKGHRRKRADMRARPGGITRWGIRILSAAVIPDLRGRNGWSCAHPLRILLHTARIFVVSELAHWIVEFQALSDP